MKGINMNGSTSTSFGIPSHVQCTVVAGGTGTVFTFEVPDGETPEDENYSHTIWTEWDGIEDNISTT
tara:strand:- start:4663 stop:4863 length:201 start_codon:yes stop_codon:yes gene_type:complete